MAKKFFGAVFADGTKITRTSNGWKDFTHAWKKGDVGWDGKSWTKTGFATGTANAVKGAAGYGNPAIVAEVVAAKVFASAKEMKAWKGGA